MPGVEGFMYPNEIELQWSVLIVLYPFLTGLVAGAFILASLERVFQVEAVKPTYRLALLTALAFLLVAPLPLQLHLGHPERSFEMYLTPHSTSAMAMFGFVYLWYLMAVLVLGDLARLPARYRAAVADHHRLDARDLPDLTLGSNNISERALRSTTEWAGSSPLIGHPFGVSAARICRVHLRLGQGEPVVVVAADAGRVYLLRHGLGHRRRDAALHALDVGRAKRRSTCAAWTRSRSTCSTSSSSISAWRCST